MLAQSFHVGSSFCTVANMTSVPRWASAMLAEYTWLPHVLKSQQHISLGLPCCGLNAARDVVSGWKSLWPSVAITTSFAFDFDANLGPELLSRDDAPYIVGAKANILDMDLKALPVADVIIAGPPCPPWSSLGMRNGGTDSRARVFDRVLSLIASQRRRGCKCVILENVVTITHDVGSGSQCDLYENRLRRIGYTTTVLTMNTRDYGFPQSRRRVYIVGILSAALSAPMPTVITPWRTRLSLRSLVDMHLPAVERRALPAGSRKHFSVYVRKAREFLRSTIRPRPVAVCNVARRPGGFAGDLTLGYTTTLTTTNAELFFVTVDKNNETYHRYFTLTEHCRLQGFEPKSAKKLSKTAAIKTLGNAFSVPVVATVLAHALRSMSRANIMKRKRATK